MTGIIGQVNAPIVAPIQGTVNSVLGIVDPLNLLPPLSIDLTGILANAAAGNNITLDVLDTNGNIVSPSSACNLTSNSLTLDNPAGIAIGGNAITGLGATGQAATAAELDAVALGNNAQTTLGATGAVAIGRDATASAANSVALGAGSVADRGPILGYTAPGLTGTFNSVGSVSVGSAAGLRQITNVAPGTTASDAATVGQVQGAVGALAASAVQYTDASHTAIALNGAGGTTLSGLAPGALSATSTDAVNGAQLFASNQQIAANSADIVNLDGRVTTNTTNIANLDGRVTTNTTDIANLDGRVTANTTDIANLDNRVTTNTTAITNLDGRVTANTTAITNLGNTVSNIDARVTVTETAITNLQGAVANVPVGYVSDADGTTPSPTPTNTAAFAGAAGGTVRVTNVGPGQLAAGSTDAVNGAQLNATNQQVAANTTTIAQHTVQIANLTTQVANVPIQYSNSATPLVPNGGTPTNDVTLVGGNGAAPVALHNVAAGSLANDAVNFGQFQSGLNQTLATANAYTDARFAALGFDLRGLRDEANAGTAGALAAAGLPQVMDSSGVMVAGAVGHYRGQTAFAVGASSAFNDGRGVLKFNATVDTHGYAGVSGGAGFTF